MRYLFDTQSVPEQIDVIRKHLRVLLAQNGPMPREMMIDHDMTPDIDEVSDAGRAARAQEAALKRSQVTGEDYVEPAFKVPPPAPMVVGGAPAYGLTDAERAVRASHRAERDAIQVQEDALDDAAAARERNRDPNAAARVNWPDEPAEARANRLAHEDAARKELSDKNPTNKK